MKRICTTRFNNHTIEENNTYKSLHDNKCIYGTSIPIKDDIPINSLLYVIEMNNEENKITGIGQIINKRITDKKHKIYSDYDYNRYIYTGKRYINKNMITDKFNKTLIYVLEQLLFKGSRHSKRAQGITELPNWIINNRYKFNFIKCFNELFNKYN